MNPNMAYVFALGSSLCFTTASLVFADVSRRVSPLWMNVTKALVAWVCFALAVSVLGAWSATPALSSLALLASGAVGLAIGDIFLLTAYARMGAARTLILFGFQPLFIGLASYVFFHQELSPLRFLSILFFIGCVVVFSLERYRQDGTWELWGLAAALVAVLFDNTGVLLSRYAFEHAPEMSAFQANLLRCTGALFLFTGLSGFTPVHLRRGWIDLSRPARWGVIIASMVGCFVSLFLYLTAVKIGHLASIAALAGAGPILSAALECAWQRKRPSVYLVIALTLFMFGFYLLNTF